MEHGYASSFRANKGASDIEAVFRQQLVQVIAGDAPFQFGEPAADSLLVSIDEFLESFDDLCATSACLDMLTVGLVICRADPESGAVICEDFQTLDVLDGLAGHRGMRAARVV